MESQKKKERTVSLEERTVINMFWFVTKNAVTLVVYNNTACVFNSYKKKIDKSIDFLRGWEEKMVSIFCLRSCGQVELSLGPDKARSEIYT